MVRGLGRGDRPPWWATVLLVAGAVWLVIGTVLALHRTARGSTETAAPLAPSTSSPSAAARPAVDLSKVHDVLFIGDSWTYGTNAQPVTQGFAYLTAQQLGVHGDVYGWGSVGYLYPGADGAGSLQQRWDAAHARVSPDLVILEGSQNDAGQDMQKVGAAATAFVSSLRAQFPAAQFLMVGPAPVTAGLASSLQPVESTLSRVAAAQGVPFINPLQEQWIRVADFGRYVDPMDGHPHLNNAGHAHYADQLVADLRGVRG